MKSKLLALIVLFVMASSAIAVVPIKTVKAATTPVVRVEPSLITGLDLGAEFTVSVYVDSPDIPIWSGQVGIGFNNSVLECVSFEQGDWVASIVGGGGLWMPGTIKNDQGYVTYSGWSCVAGVGMEPGYTGTDLEALRFTFRVIGYGSSVLDLTTETTTPDKYYRTKLNQLVDSTVTPIEPIEVVDGSVETVPPPAPFGPTAVIDVVTPPPYYPGTTIVFDGSKSLPGFDGSNVVPITGWTWDFGDGSPKESGVSVSHAYTDPGTYTVNLTVYAPVNRPETSNYDWTTVEITVFVKPTGPVLDVYTQSYRSYNTADKEHWTPYNGTGPGMPADAFQPQDEVTLFAKITYNDDPVCNKLVSFEVHNPKGNVTVLRTATTDENGIAMISFRIPWPCENAEDEVFGTWTVNATADVAETFISDTLSFEVGWIIEVHSFITIDPNAPHDPLSSFKKGEGIAFQFNVTNIAMVDVVATFSITVYDDAGVPIGQLILGPWRIEAGSNNVYYDGFMYVELVIPLWAYKGTGTAYLNAYTDLPFNGGTAYCPEVSTYFSIESA